MAEKQTKGGGAEAGAQAPTQAPDRPDAVKIPHAYRGAAMPPSAQYGLAGLAERLLGVDRSKGERALCRNQGGYVFATRDRGQTLQFDDRHPLRGRPRYEWRDRGDGVEVGTLVPEARGEAGPDA